MFDILGHTDGNRIDIQPAPDGTPATFQWTTSDGTAEWELERTSNGVLNFYHYPTSQQVGWFDTNGVFHVQDISIEGASSLDAGTLDGLDSAQFVRSDVSDTINASLNVTGTLSEAGNSVLTTADEGSLDAGTLAGNTVSQVRPSVSDDTTQIEAAPTDLNLGQYLTATSDGDSTVTIDSLGGNAVGETTTASGDGSTTTFTLSHNLGTTPASVDVTPLTVDARGQYHVTNITSTSVDVVYASAPASGSSNLQWHCTAFGNDGSGTHAVRVDDDGVQVDLASTLNFGSGLAVTNPSDGTATIDAAVDTAVAVSDNGAQVLAEAGGLNFGDGMRVSDDGDGTVTMSGMTISNSGSQVAAEPTDLNAGDNLTASASGGAVTLHASANAATLDGIDSTQFLRSDVADDHTDTLGITTLGAAGSNTTIRVAAPLATDTGVGIQNTANAATHRLRPRREGIQALTGGGSAPTDYALSVEADATVAFVEPDTATVSGWLDTNQNAITMAGGVRVGDRGGPPSDPLDVRGAAHFHGNQAKGFTVERRTSDPSNPSVGQMWLRTDLL